MLKSSGRGGSGGKSLDLRFVKLETMICDVGPRDGECDRGKVRIWGLSKRRNGLVILWGTDYIFKIKIPTNSVRLNYLVKKNGEIFVLVWEF